MVPIVPPPLLVPYDMALKHCHKHVSIDEGWEYGGFQGYVPYGAHERMLGVFALANTLPNHSEVYDMPSTP